MMEADVANSIEQFIGAFQCVGKDSNFDAFLKQAGVGTVMRKLIAPALPLHSISTFGDGFLLQWLTSFKTVDLRFRLDTEFEETTFDGRPVMTVFSFNGSQLVKTQSGINGAANCRIIYELAGDTLTLTHSCQGIVAVETCRRSVPDRR